MRSLWALAFLFCLSACGHPQSAAALPAAGATVIHYASVNEAAHAPSTDVTPASVVRHEHVHRYIDMCDGHHCTHTVRPVAPNQTYYISYGVHDGGGADNYDIRSELLEVLMRLENWLNSQSPFSQPNRAGFLEQAGITVIEGVVALIVAVLTPYITLLLTRRTIRSAWEHIGPNTIVWATVALFLFALIFLGWMFARFNTVTANVSEKNHSSIEVSLRDIQTAVAELQEAQEGVHELVLSDEAEALLLGLRQQNDYGGSGAEPLQGEGVSRMWTIVNSFAALVSVMVATFAVWLGVRRSRQDDRVRILIHTFDVIHNQVREPALIKMFEEFRRLRKMRGDNIRLQDIDYRLGDDRTERNERSEYDIVIRILNYYETLAIGVEKNALDEEMLKRWWRDSYVEDFALLRAFVDDFRRDRNSYEAFGDFEVMARRWMH